MAKVPTWRYHMKRNNIWVPEINYRGHELAFFFRKYYRPRDIAMYHIHFLLEVSFYLPGVLYFQSIHLDCKMWSGSRAELRAWQDRYHSATQESFSNNPCADLNTSSLHKDKINSALGVGSPFRHNLVTDAKGS